MYNLKTTNCIISKFPLESNYLSNYKVYIFSKPFLEMELNRINYLVAIPNNENIFL